MISAKKCEHLAWHVAMVSRPGLERGARVGLHDRGFRVHVPTEFEAHECRGRKQIVAGRFLISPYFYVLFHTHNREEHALVLKERGVEHVLLARPSGNDDEATWFPSPLRDRVIRASERREYQEQFDATRKRSDAESDGLELGREYLVARGTGEGTTGILLSIDHGIGLLAWGNVMLRKPVIDLKLLPEKKKKVA